jgi:hypothetical protein
MLLLDDNFLGAGRKILKKEFKNGCRISHAYSLPDFSNIITY